MPREVVVAKILEKEGRLTAIPAGWLTVPAVVLKDPRDLTAPVAAAPRHQCKARVLQGKGRFAFSFPTFLMVLYQ